MPTAARKSLAMSLAASSRCGMVASVACGLLARISHKVQARRMASAEIQGHIKYLLGAYIRIMKNSVLAYVPNSGLHVPAGAQLSQRNRPPPTEEIRGNPPL